MSWTQAFEILQNLIEVMDTPSDGMEWLNRLEKTECKDAHRLGFCIAIDLASGALTPDDFAPVLNNVDNSEACPRKAFANAFIETVKTQGLTCRSRLDMPSRGLGPYIKVLSLANFINFYKKDRTLAPDDVAGVRADYFGSGVANDLSDIRESWSGANGIVWVMSRDEFDALKVGRSGDALATLLNDALGLGLKPTEKENDGQELVGVMYPEDFDSIKQPTTLDAYWVDFGWYYVSNGKQNGWGQTVSCSGTQKPLKERVHRSFGRLSSEFIGFPIGDISDRTVNRDALVPVAEQRLQAILGSS